MMTFDDLRTVGHRKMDAASGRFKPVCTHQFLPRCPHCNQPHPLSRTPAMPEAVCPDCGRPSLLSSSVEVPAVLTGQPIMMRIGFALMAIGRYFANLGKENS